MKTSLRPLWDSLSLAASLGLAGTGGSLSTIAKVDFSFHRSCLVGQGRPLGAETTCLSWREQLLCGREVGGQWDKLYVGSEAGQPSPSPVWCRKRLAFCLGSFGFFTSHLLAVTLQTLRSVSDWNQFFLFFGLMIINHHTYNHQPDHQYLSIMISFIILNHQDLNLSQEQAGLLDLSLALPPHWARLCDKVQATHQRFRF